MRRSNPVRQIVTRIEMNDKQLKRRIQKLSVPLGGLALLLSIVACGANGNNSISLTAHDYSFAPATWNVKAGERVTLRMLNESNNEHEWVLMQEGAQITMPFDADDEARIAFESEVEPGNAKVSFFRAPEKPGVYRIVCGLPGHLEQGMEGTLVVQ